MVTRDEKFVDTGSADNPEILVVEVDGVDHKIDIKDLTLDEDSVNKHLCHQAGKFHWVANLQVKAKLAVERAEAILKITSAEVDSRIRQQSEKKPTEDAIKSMVLRDPAVAKQAAAVAKLRESEQILNVLVTSYSQRKDCLIALASNMRAQLAISSASSV